MTRRPTNFDSVASIYRWAEYLALGPLLQRTRTHFLPALADRREALVLGDGDGRFLQALLQQNPHIRVRAVDSSRKMLTLLRHRCAFAQERLDTEKASLLDYVPEASTDLIVTHFVLDCFSQIEINTIAKRMSTAKPDALWLLSDFDLPHKRLFRPVAALYIRCLYLAFAALTGLRVRELPSPQLALKAAGFTCLKRHERLNGFLYTEIWQRNSSTAVAIHSSMNTEDQTRNHEDAIPDPEPVVPSLAQPDPAVYHHEVGTPQPHPEKA